MRARFIRPRSSIRREIGPARSSGRIASSGRRVDRRELLAAASRHPQRPDAIGTRQQVLRLLLHRPADPGSEIRGRADLPRDRRREYASANSSPINREHAPRAARRASAAAEISSPTRHIAHDCTVGDAVIFSNNGTLAGHVQVGDHAVIGGLTAVHQFCRIGRFAITGGCSKIVQDVPPFMIADGNPAEVRGINQVGLERNGFAPERIKPIKEAFRLIYRAKLNTARRMEALASEKSAQSEEVQAIMQIHRGERARNHPLGAPCMKPRRVAGTAQLPHSSATIRRRERPGHVVPLNLG